MINKMFNFSLTVGEGWIFIEFLLQRKSKTRYNTVLKYKGQDMKVKQCNSFECSTLRKTLLLFIVYMFSWANF